MNSSESAGRPETATFNDDIRPLFREKERTWGDRLTSPETARRKVGKRAP